MATVLLQSAGTALGSVFGPFGAILGRAVGGLAGAALDQSRLGKQVTPLRLLCQVCVFHLRMKAHLLREFMEPCVSLEV
ncbi:hypothetical protein [Lentilitoribacter sp. EG35]|uniref:hypothetical protein n=1 Tax=Lentilitoribacter sp. EG35 TaxID=3234192 RepID=UPI0034604FBD